MANKAMNKGQFTEMSTQVSNCGCRNSIFASLEEAEYRMSNVEGLVPNEPAAAWLVRGLQR